MQKNKKTKKKNRRKKEKEKKYKVYAFCISKPLKKFPIVYVLAYIYL